jgi:predicted DNA-binding ribbon-helix-helix protein
MASAQQRRRTPRPSTTPPSALTIRNIVVAGHRTSVRLEPVMWDALREIAQALGLHLNDLVTEIDRRRIVPNLTAAIRVYIVDYYRKAAAANAEAAARPPQA